MYLCAFNRCPNSKSGYERNHVVYYFPFPQNLEKIIEWTAIVAQERKEPRYEPSKYSRICSKHFHPDDIIHVETDDCNCMQLKETATPTLNNLYNNDTTNTCTDNMKCNKTKEEPVSAVQPITPENIEEKKLVNEDLEKDINWTLVIGNKRFCAMMAADIPPQQASKSLNDVDNHLDIKEKYTDDIKFKQSDLLYEDEALQSKKMKHHDETLGNTKSEEEQVEEFSCVELTNESSDIIIKQEEKAVPFQTQEPTELILKEDNDDEFLYPRIVEVKSKSNQNNYDKEELQPIKWKTLVLNKTKFDVKTDVAISPVKIEHEIDKEIKLEKTVWKTLKIFKNRM